MVIVNNTPCDAVNDFSIPITTDSIVPFFQPIVSIKERRIVGFETLLRGIDPQTSEIIPPAPILTHARENDLSCELQRIICSKAVEEFSNFCRNNQACSNSFLTLNVDPLLIEQKMCSLRCIMAALREHNVKFSNIVFEIVESNIVDMGALEKFCDVVRENHFLIALDDMGKGHSNLNRVVALRPDIIKLDKFLIKDIQKEYYKQEVVKSLVALAHKTGALVIAEGIETEEEAIPNLSLNADMLQGFFFAKPKPIVDIPMGQILSQLKYLEWVYTRSIKNRVNYKRDILRSYDTVIAHIVDTFSRCDPTDFETVAQDRVGRHQNFECLYVLDESGIQVTNTISPLNRPLKPKSVLYHPASKNTDQSSKEYFQYMDMGLGKYITDPYISMATGNMCITISIAFKNQDAKYVLCIDAIPDFLYA